MGQVDERRLDQTVQIWAIVPSGAVTPRRTSTVRGFSRHTPRRLGRPSGRARFEIVREKQVRRQHADTRDMEYLRAVRCIVIDTDAAGRDSSCGRREADAESAASARGHGCSNATCVALQREPRGHRQAGDVQRGCARIRQCHRLRSAHGSQRASAEHEVRAGEADSRCRLQYEERGQQRSP